MTKVKITAPKQKGPPVLFVAGVFVCIALLFVGGAWLLSGAMHRHADNECTELCDALGHKKVKMTDLGCVCENPETKDRKVYAGPVEMVD